MSDGTVTVDAGVETATPTRFAGGTPSDDAEGSASMLEFIGNIWVCFVLRS